MHIIIESGGIVHVHGCCESDQEEDAPAPSQIALAVLALNELIHMSNLHLPDGSTVTLQVEVLRPRLLAIKAALTGAP